MHVASSRQIGDILRLKDMQGSVTDKLLKIFVRLVFWKLMFGMAGQIEHILCYLVAALV